MKIDVTISVPEGEYCKNEGITPCGYMQDAYFWLRSCWCQIFDTSLYSNVSDVKKCDACLKKQQLDNFQKDSEVIQILEYGEANLKSLQLTNDKEIYEKLKKEDNTLIFDSSLVDGFPDGIYMVAIQDK